MDKLLWHVQTVLHGSACRRHELPVHTASKGGTCHGATYETLSKWQHESA